MWGSGCLLAYQQTPPPPPVCFGRLIALLVLKRGRNATKVSRVQGFDTFFFSDSVLRGSGAEVGASNHGTGATRERAGHLSPGCHALPARLFPGQDGRSVLDQT